MSDSHDDSLISEFNSMEVSEVLDQSVQPQEVLDRSVQEPVEQSQEPAMQQENRPSDYIQITVKTLSGQTIAIEINPGGPVSALKEKIHTKLGISPVEQRLIFSGKQLDSMQPLSAYGVEEGSMITLVLRLRGGH